MVPNSTQVIGATQHHEEEQLVQLFEALNTVSRTADKRVAAESNKTFVMLLETMEAIKASLQLNSEATHQLQERLNAAEQRNKELELLHQSEKKASDERVATLQERVNSLSERLQSTEDKVEVMQQMLQNHTHPYFYHHALVVRGGAWGHKATNANTAAPNKSE